MADRPLGPGWWQASDAQWYPPELHPDAIATASPTAAPDRAWVPPTTPPDQAWTPPTPTAPASPGAAQWTGAPPSWTPAPPPSAPGRQRRTAWIAVAAAVVVALVVLVTFVGSSSTKRSASSDVTSASDRATSAAPGTTATGPILAAHRAGVRITLPKGWVGASIEDGVAGVGVKMFPDDPTVASDVEQRMQALPRLVVLFGVDAAEAGAASGSGAPQLVANVNVLHDPSVPKTMSLEEAASAEARGVSSFGGNVLSVDLVPAGGVDMRRVTYTLKAGFGGAMYVVASRSGYWVLTYTFENPTDANIALADGSAATFVAD